MNDIIKWQFKKYYLSNEKDIYKLLFQSEFAGGHMIKNENDSLKFLNEEINEFISNNLDNKSNYNIYEYISKDYVRINLLPFVKYNLDISYLNKAFVSTSNNNKGDLNNFIKTCKSYDLVVNDYNANHHSDIYKLAYNPHYRVVDKSFITNEMRILQVLNFINNINNDFFIVSLEGKCASGKTTLCNELKKHLDFVTIHVDDFFKPKNDLNLECYKTNDESIDYVRLRDVLLNIKNNLEISYLKYDCSKDVFLPHKEKLKRIIILEGVYSYHPYFRDLIDYLIFYEVSSDLQEKRIKERTLYQKFIDVWIPQENKYYEKEHIEAIADIII